MTSEVENLIKGLVVEGEGFATSRKLIGVANENLVPNTSGVAPLAKQTAFSVEKKEEKLETFDDLLNPEAAEKTNEPVSNQPVESETVQSDTTPTSIPEQSKVDEITPTIDMPQIDASMSSEVKPDQNSQSSIPDNNVVLENPIDVANLDPLSSLTKSDNEEIKEEKTVEVEKNAPLFDLQMPQIPDEVKAKEPETLDTGLFENKNSLNNSAQEEKIQDDVASTPAVEVPGIVNIEEVIEEKRKAILDKLQVLNDEINKCLDEIKSLSNTKMNKNDAVEEKKTVETKSEDNNTLVNDAIDQINNMVIPTLDNNDNMSLKL